MGACIEGAGMGSNAGKGNDAGGGCDTGRGSARSSAACAGILAEAEHASGFACLPDCSPAPYGLSSAVRLRFGSPMCWAISALLTLPLGHLLARFTPIHVAVSGQEHWLGPMFSFSGRWELLAANRIPL